MSSNGRKVSIRKRSRKQPTMQIIWQSVCCFCIQPRPERSHTRNLPDLPSHRYGWQVGGSSDTRNLPDLRSHCYGSGDGSWDRWLLKNTSENPQVPNRPAPPPLDHLDQQPLQQHANYVLPGNHGAQMFLQNDYQLDIEEEPDEHEEVHEPPNLRHNRAPPPPENEI